MVLMANSTNNIDLNSTATSRPNTNPLPHRDLLHPKVNESLNTFIWFICVFFRNYHRD